MEKQQPLMLTLKILSKEWGRYLRKITGEIGVPDSYRHIIMFLSCNPGASQKKVAEVCQLTGAAVSQIIKEMQLAGYIKKEVDSSDGRYFNLFLTEKAESKVEIIRSKIDIADNYVTEKIGKEKEIEIVKVLSELTQTLKEEI